MNLPSRGRRASKPRELAITLGACLIAVTARPAGAQRVPIDFDEFHGYEATVDYVRRVARAYPDITELVEIGRSNMDRPIYVLVISNMNNGTTIDQHVELRNVRGESVDNVRPMKSYQGKPGQWIDGATHGNEFTGTEVSLYIIDKLTSGYGRDSVITRLVDDDVFYICPIVNPDGVYNSVERGISQRQNSMLRDDDEDGQINEDGPDDLNGDGHFTSFRYRDPEGRYVIDDIDPRHMVRLEDDEETTKQRYSVVREDRDNDGDGERGEDPERGIDVNRNYPEGWFRDDNSQGGSGFYAASSPEARAILEYLTNNTNILMVQSYHTSGGFTYRPLARWPDDSMHAEDRAVFDRIMGRKYLELHDAEIPEAWQDVPSEPESGGSRAGQRSQDYELPRLWRHPYNDQADRAYGYGIFLDWAYAQFGTYSMSTELWSWQHDTRGVPGFGGEDDRDAWFRALLAYQDSELDGEVFVDWEPYTHPELGSGEIGGWISTFGGGNAIPGESLVRVCENHWQFELFKADLLPKLEITSASAEVLYTTDNATDAAAAASGDTFTIRQGGTKGAYKIVKVTATIENTGALATHVAQGADLAGNREDVIWLIGERDRMRFIQGTVWQSLGVIDGSMEVPGFTPELGRASGRPQRPRGQPSDARPAGEQVGNQREVTWLVAVEGDTPLKLVLVSQKGGTKVRQLSVR